MNSIVLKAPAKINLSLDITGKRDDNYHTIKTIMQTVSLFDVIKLTAEESDNGKNQIHLSCSSHGIPINETNTAYKAAEAFLSMMSARNIYGPGGLYKSGISIHAKIEKNIPSEAGLGGGSADAAAVLRGLNFFYGNPLSEQELCGLGLKIGSDVPFCVMGNTMLVEGAGEVLTPLSPVTNMCFVVAKPRAGVSTKNAYVQFDQFCSDNSLSGTITRPDTDKLISALNSGDLRDFSSGICNVFENVIKIPEILEIKSLMKAHGCFGASMTGSGSAVYGIFEDEISALSCCKNLSELMSDRIENVFLCKPCSNQILIN